MSEDVGEDEQPWKRFDQWLHCICVVAFDLELGQALEIVYPGGAALTEKEKLNLCYLAFPDSNSGCMGDTIFHFRMRRFSGNSPLCTAHTKYDQNCPPNLKIDSAHYFGFVYFRQVKDKTVNRGYYQKSVVLITQLPLINLFTHIVGVIAPEFYANGEPGLEAACHDIDQWFSPMPGTPLTLPLLGRVIHCRIPAANDQENAKTLVQQNLTEPAPFILRSVSEPPLYEQFAAVLPHVQLLWELVLLGEPLVVMAPSPTISSSAVHALISLICPLSYAYDYRPFFTIHDSEFKEYTVSAFAPPRVILGVTNPFFTKTLQHWPHVLKIGEANNTSTISKASPISSGNKLLRGGDIRVLDKRPGLYTQYKPLLNKDNNLLKKMFKGSESKRPTEAQNVMLRRYFTETTHSFMIPLERYLGSLMPLQRQISAFKSAPKPRPFELEEFLATLDTSGPSLTTGIKGDWCTLYRKFASTLNFERWLWQRVQEMEEKLQSLHLQVVCQTDLQTALESRQEVELVDLVLKLKDKLNYVNKLTDGVTPEIRCKLEEQLRIVLSAVNEDTRQALFSSPKHANMSAVGTHEVSL